MDISTQEIDDDRSATLLAVEEGHFVDIKAIEISPAKLTRAVSAFANTSGGELFIGIDEKAAAVGISRSWRGFHTQEDANPILQAIEKMSPLGSHYAATFLTHKTSPGWVLHLLIHKSREILSSSDDRVFVRRGAQTLPVADGDALERLKYDKGIVSFEDQLLDVPLHELTNSETAIEFMLEIVPMGEPEDWLRKQRVINKEKATVAGTLLFSDLPQAHLPKRSAVKILRYTTKGEGERDTLAFQPVTIEGSTYDVIFDSVEKAKSIIESIKKLGPSGMEEVAYPEDAMHEIITNAVLHRDYSIAADVQVRIYDNRVEIESPGKFPGHITAKNVLNEQFARNPKMVRLINKFPEPPNKDVGEGLNTAFEAMEKLQLKQPEIIELENAILITLRHESLDSPEQLVTEYLEKHDDITNAIARDITGIKSENKMKRVFYRLRDSGVLEQVPEKVGKPAWRLIKT